MADLPEFPFFEHMGFEVVQRGDGELGLRLPHNPSIANPRGEIHGGAQAALVDIAMAQAILTTQPKGTTLGTITLTTTYLRPAHGDLVAIGRVLRVGRSLANAEAQVYDADEQLVGCAMGTYRLIKPRQ